MDIKANVTETELMKFMEIMIIHNTVREIINAPGTDEDKIRIIRILLEEKT